MHFAMMAVIPVYVYPEIGVLTNWFKKITEKQKNDQLDIIWTSAGYDSTLRFFPMLEIPEEAIEELIELMRNDKKNERNALNFVLLESIGKAQVNAEMTSSEVGEALLHLSLLAQHGN